MNRFISAVGAVIGGGVGWWLAARFGLLVTFFASVLGSAVGVYVAHRMVRAFLE